jgi:uncharacterized protein
MAEGVKKQIKIQEVEKGCEIYSLDPIVMKYHYEVDYIHSYAQDSPFFEGLTKKKLLGSKCPACGSTYATPRGHCMDCGSKTEWMELPHEGKVHTYTTCYFGGEEFLNETPFTLILVEWPEVNTFFLSRLIGVAPEDVQVGMPVRAKFKRLCQFKPTDVYFVPVE